MKPNIKKLLILNAPYLLFVYLFDKLCQAVRLAPGLAPFDWLIGIVGAVGFRLLIYFKSKNAKKYRKGMEYGSARWSA